MFIIIYFLLQFKNIWQFIVKCQWKFIDNKYWKFAYNFIKKFPTIVWKILICGIYLQCLIEIYFQYFGENLSENLIENFTLFREIFKCSECFLFFPCFFFAASKWSATKISWRRKKSQPFTGFIPHLNYF